MRLRVVAAALLAVALAAAVVYAGRPDRTAVAADPASRAMPAAAEAADRKPDMPGDARQPTAVHDESTPLPRSFRDTDVDGSVSVGRDGRIVATRGLCDLFDYYLSGAGEYAESNAASAVKQRLRAYARARGLSDSVRRQLLALFDRYMAYRQAAAAYSETRQQRDPAQALRRLSALRSAYLGAVVAEAFFGDETRSARAAVARQENPADAPPLTPPQEATVAPVDLAGRVSALRDDGAGEAAVAALRKQAVGRAAMQRLEALDARRAQWNASLRAYRRERSQLLDSAMAAPDRRRALTALRQRYFAPRDRRRVAALERLAAQGADKPR